jgi:FKBP-type peptidyl-prolyl cis-trans isomerase 2
MLLYHKFYTNPDTYAMIAAGTTISLQYTLSLDTGEIIESNTGKKPLVYTLGSGGLMPGIEDVLSEMKEDETRTGTLSPERGYGPIDTEAFIEVPRDHLPPEAWKKGASLQAAGPKGEQIEGIVKELKDNSAIVDFNHPLAGKSLNFTIKVLDIL